MTKERILGVFKDINQMYNNARMYDGLSKMLDELVEDSKKSVEPERKPGKWVHMVGWWECNQCHAEYTDMPTCMGKAIYEYCPMCGAKMEEVVEE